MKHYWVKEGTKIMRWDGNSWWNFVTTRDAYYTEEDNVTPDWHYPTQVTRFKIPDKKYEMISVPNDKVIRICDQCRQIIEGKGYYRCAECRGAEVPVPREGMSPYDYVGFGDV